MAEDMITRAAKAGDYEDAAQKGEPSVWSESHFPPGEEGMAELYDERRAVYQAALLAALDPEDEALVEAVAADLAEWPPKGANESARVAILAIKRMAQGHPSSQEQVRASLSDTEREDGK